MAMTVDELAEQAFLLSNEARAHLADRLVESLDPAQDGVTHELWVTEANRRLDDIRTGRVQPIPGDQGMERVRGAVAR